jgi:hypothetical protein
VVFLSGKEQVASFFNEAQDDVEEGAEKTNSNDTEKLFS